MEHMELTKSTAAQTVVALHNWPVSSWRFSDEAEAARDGCFSQIGSVLERFDEVTGKMVSRVDYQEKHPRAVCNIKVPSP